MSTSYIQTRIYTVIWPKEMTIQEPLIKVDLKDIHCVSFAVNVSTAMTNFTSTAGANMRDASSVMKGTELRISRGQILTT